ncbi:type III-B CRISPR-associated protein Cas10/Cmr2 [Ignatzschineria ureiclastica]|uniref:Type III-B CRISPR-associated protein Cas10/Cmr2 n=1 Tax=Ignatzschineria ureiclastica TaxID=472582 RepID=A0A2U2AF04_9GAMM|nr:type III-B CRISPR-associated protein Cas10/Cmr2 [Ignatzschineria ureiclastica]PWD81230.1 type III-B CRISPR-associated protein Cas10/Cmr2 [Ignatzschineria ureiclastica]GGZ97313.1 type III-B CRISPR-associated protein Cas10/Cmr2 [Ignatzschineria ureiclastica]
MNQYVLILSVGPVQGFIAAARRSRDLWSGSWLLSEMAKAGAKYLYDHGAILIFPTVADAEELNVNSELSVGNKLQVVISAQNAEAVQRLIEETKSAIQARFDLEATTVEALLGNFKIRQNIWQGQLKDYLEVQGAYALIDASNKEGYKIACDQASIMLAARKATRDFRALATSAYDPEFMIPKSSLDGARETVLPDVFCRNHHIVKRLGLSDSEQLDSSGIIKRLGGDVDQFTPYVRVAADSWVQNISDEEANNIAKAYKPLVDLQLATNVTGNHSCYAKLPYDGEYLYSFRLEAMLNRYKSWKRKITNKESLEVEDLDLSEVEQAYQVLLNLKEVLQPLWRKYGDPCNYGVLLLADGDKMGELLDHAGDQTAHQEITTALSQFAGSVEAIMRDHYGHRIYAGGDDVLGFVPLASAYDCAKTLSEKFAASLDTVAKKLKATTPTLSVGLAIAHINTPLGHIRHLAKEAEKMAKGDQVKDLQKQRNALGIVLAVRSGSTTGLRLRWDDEAGLQAFQTWIDDYQQHEITSRLAYDTREIYLQTELLARDIENDLLVKIRAAEFKRMLKKARTTSGTTLDNALVSKLEKRLDQLESLDHLATELIIARWMAAKTQRDLGRE